MNLQKIRGIVLTVSLIILAWGSGYWLGKQEVFLSWKNFKPQMMVVNKEAPLGRPIDFSLFWDVWERLARDFIEKSKLDPQKMVWGAISGMVQSLEDPYTVFLPPKENKEIKEELGGSFEGIGAQLGMEEKKIIVIAPLPGTPAEKAGILPGDVILKVNGEEASGWTLPQAVSKIRGPKGSKVSLTILHQDENEAVTIEVVRGTIKVPSVEQEGLNVKCQILNGEKRCEIIKGECQECLKVVHLRLMRFGDKTAQEWEKAVREINYQSSIINDQFKGVILDVRNNPGGYLQGAVFIASEFLEKGVVVIQENASGERETFSVNREGKLTNIPLVILINKGSASASEIVAGALSERAQAKIVGTASFGKGSIQEAQDLSQGAGLHITTSRWLLPSGTSINGEGLEPDVKIEDEPKTEKDEQLEKAAEVLCQ